ncbi:MAG: enoyl-CoA hydratase/isomerase family protein [Deltaproteobacteria bacterium]|nr:enoyl-CoA hydratase/isomerase family protein [Deltaproteobacteria bacterium]
MSEEKILYTKEDGIGIITFNRPERMNAITNDMQARLHEIVAEVIEDREVRVLIVTGSGRAFCGGIDVSLLARSAEESDEASRQRPQYAELPDTSLPKWFFTRIPKPTIAAVNGAAVGMGAEWAVQCDFRIASEQALFGWVFSRRGITTDSGAGAYLLPYIIGLSNALEIMYSGEIFDAKKALELGLVSKVVPQDELLPVAKELARKLMRGAPLSIKGIKELTYGALEWPPSVHHEETRKSMMNMRGSEDSKEGAISFLEKREPVWKGK